MDASPSDSARCASPRTPYPGLRPFLDHEEMLLHGRDRQIREVVARLGAPMSVSGPVSPGGPATPGADAGDHAVAFMRFVAVLGGSGSGKSSLIHAGVVPELRQLRHPGAPATGGMPMTCTPGTNVNARRHRVAPPIRR